MKETKAKSNKLGKKFLYSIFLVVLIIDFAISSALFLVFSSSRINLVRQNSVAQLEQVCTATDILYSSLEAVSNQILSDPDTFTSIYASDIDRLREAKSCTRLKNIKTAYPYIRFIGIYNASIDRYLSNTCVASGEEMNIQSFYDDMGEARATCILRNVGSSYPTSTMLPITVYTFAFKVKVKPNSDVDDLIIIDVNASYFNDVLANIRNENVEQQVLFADSQNRIITKRIGEVGRSNFTTAIPQSSLDIAAMNSSPRQSGTITIDGEFITYAHAKEAGWTIINVVPYSTVIEGLSVVAFLTITLFLITLGLGYIISRRMSNALYAPIRTVYDNYVAIDYKRADDKRDELEVLSDAFSEMYSRADRLEQGLISSYTQSKNLYVERLLTGRVDAISDTYGIYDRLGIDLHSPYYGILIIECSPQTPTDASSSDANIFIYHYALQNITEEIVNKSVQCEFLRTDQNSFAVLYHLENEKIEDKFVDGLQEIPAIMGREFGMETTICVGPTTDSWHNINMIYEQTRIAMESRALDHSGQVFFFIEKAQQITADQYYNKLYAKFSEYVRSGDIDACTSEFDVAISSMENISFAAAKSYFRHVAMSVLDDFSSSLEKNNDTFAQLVSHFDRIDEQQNVSGLRSVMIDFLNQLIYQVSVARKNSNQDVAEEVKDYIDKNYSNPDLTLKMLADIVKLSPAYLGKIFSSVTTYTFNDYLSFVRMNCAAELLKDTKKPVSEISESVGMLNTNYFYSLFKKQFGMTPSEYRKKN